MAVLRRAGGVAPGRALLVAKTGPTPKRKIEEIFCFKQKKEVWRKGIKNNFS